MMPTFFISYMGRKFEIRHMERGWVAGEIKVEPSPLEYTFHTLGSANSPEQAFKDIIQKLGEPY